MVTKAVRDHKVHRVILETRVTEVTKDHRVHRASLVTKAI